MRFHARELAVLRETAQASMTSTLRRVTVTKEDDGHGGYTESPSEGTATVCRIAPVSGIEQLLGGRVDSRKRFKVFAPHDFTADPGDRLDVDGTAYEIEYAQSPRSEDEVERVFEVYRIE